MSMLLFSDLHSNNFEQFSEKLPSGRNSRLQDCLNVVEQAETVCRERQIDYCYFLGDCHDSRTKLDIDVLTSTRRSFQSLSKAVKRLIMLTGNHDCYAKAGEIHSIDSYKDFALVIDTPQILNQYGGCVVCYPWTSDVEGMKHWINNLPEISFDCLFFHQGVSEAAVGVYDMHIKTEISLKDIPLGKFKIVAAGDFHKRQFLANGKFHYLGSPLQLSFGEREDNKCFTLIHDDWTIESIPTNAPRFHLFENADAYEKEKDKIGPKDFVKVLDTNRIKLEQIKATSPRTQTVLIKGDEQKQSRINSTIASSDAELLRTWISRANTEQDSDLLLEEGLALLRGSSE